MDSFYDVPRRAPPPTHINTMVVAPTAVPEISMVCNTENQSHNHATYNSWQHFQRYTDNGFTLTSNRANIMGRQPLHFNQAAAFSNQHSSTDLYKKQVRFESPVLQQRPSLSYEPFVSLKNEEAQQICPSSVRGNNQTQDVPFKNSGFGSQATTFEQIYMANIPNRQLDLSLIDLRTGKENIPNETSKRNGASCEVDSIEVELKLDKSNEKIVPKSYREFLDSQKKKIEVHKGFNDDSITDIFNYKKHRSSDNFKGPEVTSNTPTTKRFENNTQIKETLPNMKDIKDIQEELHNAIISLDKPHVPYTHPVTSDYTCHFPNSCRQETESRTSPNLQRKAQKCDGVTQTTDSQYQHMKEYEPSNKDLLKIISHQNEQLLLLQKQVAMLLNRNQNQAKPIEPAYSRHNYVGEKCITSTQNEQFKHPVPDTTNTPRKRALSKFSIDLMTSFEVAIRPQGKHNFVGHEAKIQELTEIESLPSMNPSSDQDEKMVDQSLILQEPVKVREMCPSPEPSVNINMNDYDSSDDEVTASEIGATFYHNLMSQVNNILKKAHLQTREDLRVKAERKPPSDSQNRNKTMNQVKEATLKHLRSIGVTIAPIDDSDSSSSTENECKEYGPKEISFAVKQLLMKYLPDEQLAKIAQTCPRPSNNEEHHIGLPNRPEFSFASLQYLKKYNLISPRDPNGEPKIRKVQCNPTDTGKILDMTALKMQPKLL